MRKLAIGLFLIVLSIVIVFRAYTLIVPQNKATDKAAVSDTLNLSDADMNGDTILLDSNLVNHSRIPEDNN